MKRKIIAAIAGIIALAAIPGCSNMNQEWHHNCTVQGKERLIQEGTSSSKRPTVLEIKPVG